MVWYGMGTEWDGKDMVCSWGDHLPPPLLPIFTEIQRPASAYACVSVLSILFVFVEKDMVGEGSDHAGQRERRGWGERGYGEIDG